MSITKSIKKLEQKFDKTAESFIWKHPLLGYAAVFIGVPLLVLACVCICTMLIIYPIAWMFSWL